MYKEKYLKPDKKLDFEMYFGKWIKILDWDGHIFQGFLIPYAIIKPGKGLKLLNPATFNKVIEYKFWIKEIILLNGIHIKSEYFNDFKNWELVSKEN